MPLCFIEPQDAIRVIAESVGREARRQLVSEVVRAWVDDIPEPELSVHYAKAIEKLKGYHYPGNVRELMHVLERGAILAGDRMEIGADEIRLRRTTRG